MSSVSTAAMPKNDQRFHSAWNEGSKAARDGKQSKDCPYRAEDYMFVAWHNGWSFTKHNIAKDDEL